MTTTPLPPRREGIRPPRFSDQFAMLDFEAEPMPVISLFNPPRGLALEEARIDLRGDDLRHVSMSWYDLYELPLHEQTLPFVCQIFNWHEVITWQGVRLSDVLTHTGITVPETGYLAFRSRDGHYFETLSRDEAMDPRVLVVVGMNGGFLPKEHGGPVRLVVPFLQGYKSVKWLTGIQSFRKDPAGIKRLLGQSKTARLGSAWTERLGIEPAEGRPGDPDPGEGG